MQEYIDEMVKQGYIAEDGTPLKCHFCGSKKLEEVGQYYEDCVLVEYEVKCKLCGKRVGYWAYGSWEL